MKAMISNGLLAAMAIAITLLAWQGRHTVRTAFRDDVLSCNCGDVELSYTPGPKPPGGSDAAYYIATCNGCGLRRQVVDLDWRSTVSIFNGWLDSLSDD
jgi:hypothetical protein